jgi:hypothetical protein
MSFWGTHSVHGIYHSEVAGLIKWWKGLLKIGVAARWKYLVRLGKVFQKILN